MSTIEATASHAVSAWGLCDSRNAVWIWSRTAGFHSGSRLAAALRQAEWLWTYERSRAQTRYEAGLLPQVAVFGLLSSATLSFCVLGIHLPPAQLFPNMTTVPTWHIWVAWTVLGTATTSFLLTIGRILVRIAGDDATTRTFANAARSYGLCVVSGGLLACLTVSTADAAETAQMSIAMGIAVGLLGDRAFLAVSNRAAALLGAEPEVVDPGNELRTIEGLGAEDQQRLQEESIGSVHALAFVPVPRLFFNSSLNLQRICDWQDQALLQVYIGATRARALREFFQIRGAIDAQRLADGVPFEVLDADPPALRRRGASARRRAVTMMPSPASPTIPFVVCW